MGIGWVGCWDLVEVEVEVEGLSAYAVSCLKHMLELPKNQFVMRCTI